MSTISKIIEALKKAGSVPTQRTGKASGIFFGNKIDHPDALKTKLPTRGADVAYIGPVEHFGNGSNAPVADAVDFGMIKIPRDISLLTKYFSPGDTTPATDLAGLIALKRQGKEVVHFLSNQDPSALVSIDLRHVDEDELLKKFVKELVTKTDDGNRFYTRNWLTQE